MNKQTIKALAAFFRDSKREFKHAVALAALAVFVVGFVAGCVASCS